MKFAKVKTRVVALSRTVVSRQQNVNKLGKKSRCFHLGEAREREKSGQLASWLTRRTKFTEQTVAGKMYTVER